MAPRNTRTLIVRSGFPAGTSSADVAQAIAREFSGMLEAIQFCPGGYIRITFSERFTDPKRLFEEAGSVNIGAVQCEVFQTNPTELVLLYLLPHQGGNDCIS